ncbi:MAG: hypothetical protein H7843_03360 [Nitrospirota bacterium]
MKYLFSVVTFLSVSFVLLLTQGVNAGNHWLGYSYTESGTDYGRHNAAVQNSADNYTVHNLVGSLWTTPTEAEKTKYQTVLIPFLNQ